MCSTLRLLVCLRKWRLKGTALHVVKLCIINVTSCDLVLTTSQLADYVLYLHVLQGRTYTIESEIDSFAKREAVLDVLTDYPNHSEVFSSIVSSQVVARRDSEAEVLQVQMCNIVQLQLTSCRCHVCDPKQLKQVTIVACCRKVHGMCCGSLAAFRHLCECVRICHMVAYFHAASNPLCSMHMMVNGRYGRCCC